MSYSPKDHRQLERKQCRDLLERDKGWYDYVIDKASKLEKAEPVIHRGLLAEVRRFVENARHVSAVKTWEANEQ